MARYRKQNDPGGTKVIPSVTEIIGDCTSGVAWAMPYGSNQACDWIISNCQEYDVKKTNSDPFYAVFKDELRRFDKTIDKKYPDNARYAHKHHSKKARDIGSLVHDHIERYMRNRDESYMNLEGEAFNAFTAFLEWSEEHNLKPNGLEMTVYGETNGNPWAGTLDFFGEFDGKLYTIDWKTSAPANKKTGKGIRKTDRIQVAAYRSVMEICDGCGVLRIDKTTGLPDWNDISEKNYKQDLKIFNRMVDLYYDQHEQIGKKARGE